MGSAERVDGSEGTQKVATFLGAAGHRHKPLMLDGAARTAQQAADALGVFVGQIAKSIIFQRRPDNQAVLVITAGDQRVDERKVQALVCVDGQTLGRADAAFVKSNTGFSIGGVPPVAHAVPSVTLVDQSLSRFPVIWAAAGHPHAVFEMSFDELVKLADAPASDVVVDPAADRQALQRAIDLVTARAKTLDASSEVPSPCISVCRMSAATGWCEGCFRSSPEIAAWSQAHDSSKREVWALIGQRMQTLQATLV